MPAETERRDEAGMTVLEVVIASAILLAALAMMLGLLSSLMTNENRTQALVSNEQNVRFVLNDFAKDVRGADPVTIWTTRTQYRTQLRMQTSSSSGEQFVAWIYDTSARTLRRETYATNTATTAQTSVVRLTRVRNQERSIPLLEYFASNANDDGDELVANNADPAQIASCSVRVRMTITSDSQPGPEPFTESLDVHLRNRLPGGFGCPI